MKALSIVLAVIAVCLIALIAVFYIGGALGTGVVVDARPAQEDVLSYAAIVEAAQAGRLPATFAEFEGMDAANLSLTNVTVTFYNNGLFDAEFLTFAIQPGAGDLAVYSQSAETLDIPARSSAQLNLKLVCDGAVSSAGRTLEIEYYVLGMRRTATISIEE